MQPGNERDLLGMRGPTVRYSSMIYAHVPFFMEHISLCPDQGLSRAPRAATE